MGRPVRKDRFGSTAGDFEVTLQEQYNQTEQVQRQYQLCQETTLKLRDQVRDSK